MTVRLWRGIGIGLVQAAIVIAGVLSNLATGDSGPPPPPPALTFKAMSVSPQQALPNQTITVHWDYDNPDRLRGQWMEIISLTLRGQLLRVVEGKPMTAAGQVEPGFENKPVLPTDVRDKSFTFGGPVTVLIGAIDQDNKIVKAAVDVTLRDAFLRVSVNPVQENLAYPRLFLPDSKPHTLEFPVFFATYDEPPNQQSAPNGVIDYFLRLGVMLDSDGSHPFFGRSYLDNEGRHFGFSQGIKFPLLAADYLLTSPDAFDQSQNQRFQELGGMYLVADGILIGAKIAYQGDVLVTKGPTGDVTSQTGNLSMEPIFFQIDLRTELTGALHIADMHLGNVAQGFVASAYWGLTSGRSLSSPPLPASSYSIPAGTHPTGNFTGTAGPATLGFNVNGSGQYIQVTSATWQNVPFFSDYDLSGIGLINR